MGRPGGLHSINDTNFKAGHRHSARNELQYDSWLYELATEAGFFKRALPHASDRRCADSAHDVTDPPNLRGSRSKAQLRDRFSRGVDRYIEGFTRQTNRSLRGGATNPLLRGRRVTKNGDRCETRPADFVVLAGNVGVPLAGDIARRFRRYREGFQNANELATSERGR